MYCTTKLCFCNYVNPETGECDYRDGCVKEEENE